MYLRFGAREVFHSKLRSCKMSFGDYKDSLDIDPAFNSFKAHSLRVAFEIIPNSGFVLKFGLTKR